MANIKVGYRGTLRRFTVSTNIRWAELEAKLRTLFSIPSSIPISLSYTDEEGDLITLSTDLELQETFGSQQPSSNSSTFTFLLTTPNSPTAQNELTEDWVLE